MTAEPLTLEKAYAALEAEGIRGDATSLRLLALRIFRGETTAAELAAILETGPPRDGTAEAHRAGQG